MSATRNSAEALAIAIPMDSDATTFKRIVTGRLLRRHGAFILQCDEGGELELRLPRVPVDHVGKSVRVTGRMIGPALLEAEGVGGI